MKLFKMFIQHCNNACLDIACTAFTRYKSEQSTCTLHFKNSSESCSVVKNDDAMLFEEVYVFFSNSIQYLGH